MFLVVLFSIFLSVFYFSLYPKGAKSLSEGVVCSFALKFCFLISASLLLIFLLSGPTYLSLGLESLSSLGYFLGSNLDVFSLSFFLVGSFVSWSIMEFSMYYMVEDVFFSNFFRLLMLFLLKMLVLTCSDKLLVLFVGWEGVGVLSFLLMGWWKTRFDANSASIQAMIYKRVGDLGVMVMIFLGLCYGGSLSLSGIQGSGSHYWVTFFLFFTLLAACGKSSQFLFHPWLPSAMEGPTPVSALLHSSTMVVAGVFLLTRVTSLVAAPFYFNSFCLVIGAVTSMFAASVALFQFDMKKVVAYSTTSQLGLMFCSLGLGAPFLAFYHMCTHAFFKAMLFLCSGSAMHSLGKEQDLRKMGKTSLCLPVTYSCMVLGSLALSGMPFLSGFYSKDLMLESVSNSSINLLSLFLLFFASMLTAVYSLRVMTLCSGVSSGLGALNPVSEESVNLVRPMIRLGVGSIFFGWWGSLYLFNLEESFVSFSTKLSPLTLIFLGVTGLIFSFGVVTRGRGFHILFSFLTNQWNFSQFSHSLWSILSFLLSLTPGRLLDLRVLSMGVEGVGALKTLTSSGYSSYFHGNTVKWQAFFIVLVVTILFLFS